MIPTHPNQGHYTSEEELNQTYNELLGIDTTQYSYMVVVHGTTVKMTTDGGPTDATTGVFVYDTITDEDGQIYIDGENRTEDFINPDYRHEQTQKIDRADGTTETIDDDDSTVTTSSDTMWDGEASTQWWLTPFPYMMVEDQEELEDQGWEATLRMLVHTYREERDTVASSISNIRSDGTRCVATWFETESGFVIVQIECYEAKLSLQMEPQDEDGNMIPDEIIDVVTDPVARSLAVQFQHHELPPEAKGCARGVLNPDGNAWDDGFVDTDTTNDCDIPGIN